MVHLLHRLYGVDAPVYLFYVYGAYYTQRYLSMSVNIYTQEKLTKTSYFRWSTYAYAQNKMAGVLYTVHVRRKIISWRAVWQPLFSLHYFHYDLFQSGSGIQVYLLPVIPTLSVSCLRLFPLRFGFLFFFLSYTTTEKQRWSKWQELNNIVLLLVGLHRTIGNR